MLKVESLNSGYGDLHVLFDINIEIKKDEIVSIVGSNAAGKTTLLNTISGLIKPDKGKILLKNKNKEINLINMSTDEIVENGVIQVPEGRQIWSDLSVKDNLILGAYIQEARKKLDENLKFVFDLFPKLKQRKTQKAGTLSGGEQQMLAIGRALMSNPKILMLDEPSLGLAPIIVERVFETIKEIKKSGVTILIVEQNVYDSLEMSTRGYILEGGRIIKSGYGKELLEDEEVKESYLGL